MRFRFRVLHNVQDAQKNFEQIETAFGFPVFDAAPSNPGLGQAYFDTSLGFGFWNGTAWVYPT